MNVALTNQMSSPDLLASIKRQIVNRTWGRVSQLQMERVNDRISIHGFTASYYVKQLVLQAVLESLDEKTGMPVALDSKVGVRPQHAR